VARAGYRIEGERSVDVWDGICFVGLDVRARWTVGAAVQLGSAEVLRSKLSNRDVPV
jgi:hypothetical protein